MKTNTNTRLVIGILVVVVIGTVSVMATQASPRDNSVGREESSRSKEVATIYKSPSCGCCGQYAEYLSQKGYGVDIEYVEDMTAIKERFTVPYELESCHTMEIGGYVVEGHVPEEAVQKLLSEKPDMRGIGMAGMPSGSPGMPGPKTSDFLIYEITHSGVKGNVFMKI